MRPPLRNSRKIQRTAPAEFFGVGYGLQVQGLRVKNAQFGFKQCKLRVWDVWFRVWSLRFLLHIPCRL